ncbi:hypothetical protein [Spirosoma telluris]
MPVYNSGLKLNGLYSYDPTTNKAAQLNLVTAGGLITHFYKLAK